MRPCRVEELVVTVEAQGDPLLHRQAGVLARRLHGVDDLAREPLAPQLVIQEKVNGHGM